MQHTFLACINKLCITECLNKQCDTRGDDNMQMFLENHNELVSEREENMGSLLDKFVSLE